MKKYVCTILIVLFFVSTMVFAGDAVPTLKLSSWTNLQGEKTIVARGTINTGKDSVRAWVYIRQDGGGSWQEVGKGLVQKNSGYGIELNATKIKWSGKSWAKVQYLSPDDVYVESGLKAVWVKDGKLSLTRPYDKQASRIRKLEAELVKYKKGGAKVTVVKKQAVKATTTSKVIRLDAEETTNTKSATEYEIQITSGSEFEKFGMVVGGKWQEYGSGTKVTLVPGEYAVNAVSNSLWAYDSQSLSTGNPNFVLIINGISLTNGGHDNGGQGANAKFILNGDGSVTPL
jgi:hypothetical protein